MAIGRWLAKLRQRRVFRAPAAAVAGAEALGGRAGRRRHPWAALLLVAAAAAGVTTLASWLVQRARGRDASAAVPSVAVLPFADLSPSHDQEHFSDGLSEELLNALAQVPGLRVAGRTSSFSFRGKAEDVRAIGRKLGVTAVLDGSVWKQRDRIRVTAHVVAVQDGSDLWSERYDGGIEDVFQVQEEIARAVVQALRVKLRLADAAAPAPLAEGVAAAGPPAIVQASSVVFARPQRQARPEVYDAYLVGKHLAQERTPERLQRATASLERALALDAAYAPTWAELARTLVYMADLAPTVAERAAIRRRATEAADRAIQLAPDLPDGYAVRGQLRAASYDWRRASQDLDRALALRPGDAAVLRLYAGWVAGPLGRNGESADLLRRALAADPLAASAWSNLGMDLNALGELDAARDALRRALAIDRGFSCARFHLVVNALLRRDADRALATANEEPDPTWRAVGVALAQHARGDGEASRRALDEVIAKGSLSWAYPIAEIRAHRGERDQAFEWLDRAHAEGDGGLTRTRHDPLLRSLHADPRWPGLLRRLNLPEG